MRTLSVLHNKTLLFSGIIACACIGAQATAAVLRDPTLPSIGMNVGRQQVIEVETGLVLKSIIRTTGQASAVINQRILKKGDSIQGVTISDIAADSVLLSDGRRLTLFKAITEEVEK